MAATFVDFDQTTPVGRKLARALQMIREGRDVLRDAIALMEQMRNGDGSLASHYALLASEGGFQAGGYADANAAAKAAYDESASLYGKLNTNAAVTDVANAVTQAAAKLGV